MLFIYAWHVYRLPSNHPTRVNHRTCLWQCLMNCGYVWLGESNSFDEIFSSVLVKRPASRPWASKGPSGCGIGGIIFGGGAPLCLPCSLEHESWKNNGPWEWEPCNFHRLQDDWSSTGNIWFITKSPVIKNTDKARSIKSPISPRSD